MVLRTSRAPRLHAGHVGDSSVRNRASPLCALNAVRTASNDDAVVMSVSGAVGFFSVFSTFGAGWSAVDFFDSHEASARMAANAKTWYRMRAA